MGYYYISNPRPFTVRFQVATLRKSPFARGHIVVPRDEQACALGSWVLGENLP